MPRIVWSLTSERVLTMEYVPGVKINRADKIDELGVDRALLAQRAVESYLQQLLTFGFFHAGAEAHFVWLHWADAGADCKGFCSCGHSSHP